MEFDFLGKDSIRYNNSIPVDKRAYKNLERFMDGKGEGDDLFDRLNVSTAYINVISIASGMLYQSQDKVLDSTIIISRTQFAIR